MLRAAWTFHVMGKDRSLSYEKAEKMDVFLEGRPAASRPASEGPQGEKGRVLALPREGTGLSGESMSLGGGGCKSFHCACSSGCGPSASCSCHGNFAPSSETLTPWKHKPK